MEKILEKSGKFGRQKKWDLVFDAPISQYGMPKWSSSDVTDFCVQMPASKEGKTKATNNIQLFSRFKTLCKYIYTLNLLLFLYMYMFR